MTTHSVPQVRLQFACKQFLIVHDFRKQVVNGIQYLESIHMLKIAWVEGHVPIRMDLGLDCVTGLGKK